MSTVWVRGAGKMDLGTRNFKRNPSTAISPNLNVYYRQHVTPPKKDLSFNALLGIIKVLIKTKGTWIDFYLEELMSHPGAAHDGCCTSTVWTHRKTWLPLGSGDWKFQITLPADSASGKTSWLAHDCPLTVSLKDLYFPQSGKEGCMLGKRDPCQLFLEAEGL